MESNDKKIIISNVPPHVPHNIISQLMETHGVKLTSPIEYLRLSQEEGLTHVLSERRRVFISKETAEKLPSSEFVTFEDDQYRVFYNDAQIKCFICHQFGHTTQTCEFSKSSGNYEQLSHEHDQVDESMTISEIDDSASKIIPHQPEPLKRPPPSSSNSSSGKLNLTAF